tara:strand:+ start:463 stop:948 length:486 start_codon:yes stop_codon:yes gene_type:complete
MGGPSGGNSGGNDNKTKFGYTKPKSTVSKVVDFVKGGGVVGAVVRGITQGAKKSKQNVMDYEGQAAGVTPMRAPRDARTGRDNNRNNQKSIEQPKVASQMDNSKVKSKLITADKTAPTDIEMSDDELLVARKRGRKTKTVLTSITGDTSKATLSKKTLLGG